MALSGEIAYAKMQEQNQRNFEMNANAKMIVNGKIANDMSKDEFMDNWNNQMAQSVQRKGGDFNLLW